MSTNRRNYSREFKQEAIRLAERGDKTITQLEIDLGIPKGIIHKWRWQLQKDGQEAFRGHGRLSEADEELRQLRRENAQLREEREILKQTTLAWVDLRDGYLVTKVS